MMMGRTRTLFMEAPKTPTGPLQTGAWVADVTYERAAGQLESANNLKQIGLGVHALDAGERSVDICAQNSPPSSPEPVTHTGWGPWEVVLDSHIEANLVFDSTGGDRSTVVLPYLEQRGGEADDGGFVIDWTTGDGPKGGDTVGVIAIITPTEHGDSVLEFSVENFPNNSSCPALAPGLRHRPRTYGAQLRSSISNTDRIPGSLRFEN